ncbi:MAG: YidC/Oxa1 family membrane protein insertase [Treponemataceae bacterium]|nr:MAG: YidC/Oxa1 family membrane protein insertase [Treponemataceae bacterium]
MTEVLYTIIIYPLVQIIELSYLIVYRIFDHNPAVAVCGVSVVVSILTLPLYFVAEKWQQTERDTQKRLAPKIAKIKAAFKSDEQYLILSTYYRQNQYHPMYALRSSLGLLIQIPFFIAAYQYLSHLEILQGARFLGIADLSLPDRFINIGGGVNLLPVLMTAINCVSGAIYTRGFPLKDKLQIYGMAALFLVLLYNSPAGLVLYWTLNNVFSLIKNIVVKQKQVKRSMPFITCAILALLGGYVLFLNDGELPKRILVVLFDVSAIGLIIRNNKKGSLAVTKRADTILDIRLFVVSALTLFLLIGIVIPSSLIVSSVQEFSFIESYTSPFPFIGTTMMQAAGIFIFWFFCIFFLFSNKTRKYMTIFSVVLCAVSLINTFLVPNNSGFLTTSLIFSEPQPFNSHFNIALVNMLALIAAVAVIVFALYKRRESILFAFQIIVFISLGVFGAVNMTKIKNEFIFYTAQKQTISDPLAIDPVYTLSKTGKNVVVLMIDAAMGGWTPYIFEEKPNLLASFSGFTWYPNCVSFAGHTLVGATPIYGGYEYTPMEINKRNTETLVEKHQEAYTLLPRLFSDLGYSVTVTDPPFDNYHVSNLGIFSEMPEVNAENLIGKYTSLWLQNHPDIKGLPIIPVLKNNLIRFSFFKTAPFVLRYFIYDNGEWLTTKNLQNANRVEGALTLETIDDYALLDFLPRLTNISNDNSNTFTSFYGHLIHANAFLQVPDYIPATPVTDKGDGLWSSDDHYHVSVAAFILLGKWFDFLKENGVYDNTRIIIVSDHGHSSKTFPNKLTMKNGEQVSPGFNPLLMVKDFNTSGELQTDTVFMTNADAALLAVQDIIENPVNPFTQKPLQSDKAAGITATTIGALSSHSHSKYQYTIRENQWLHVRDNIFDPQNWTRAGE